MIADGYSYGRRIDTLDGMAGPVMDALSAAAAEVRPCSRCADMSNGDAALALFSVGGIGNDIVDDSNEAMIAEYAREHWSPWAHVHTGVGTTVCVNVDDDIPAEILADMVQSVESFADYPVWDEGDYSARESAAFMDTFNSESWYLGSRADASPDLDTDHPLYATAAAYAQEHYFGHSDPGDISRAHVVESWRAAGLDAPISAD